MPTPCSYLTCAFLAATLGLAIDTCSVRAAEGPVPLSLAEAKETAVRNHPRYASAQLQSFLAQAVLKETRAGYFPVATGYLDAVGATQEGTRLLAGGINNPAIYDRLAAGVTVTQTLTDFGRTSNLTASARDRARGAVAGAEAIREQIILNAETNYYAALEAQSVLKVAQETLEARQMVVKQVGAMAENKLKSSLDVSFAEVAEEQAELLVQEAKGEAEATMASLSAALGYPHQRSFVLSEDLKPAYPDRPVDELVAMALANRPDLLQLRSERDAARRSARAERDANFPTIAAVGTAGNAQQRDPHLPANFAAGGVQMSIPLFAGGAYMARQHETEARARLAEEALRDQEDNVARDVRLAWIGMRTSLQRLRTTDELLKHASEAFRLAQARYRFGSSSTVELSEAQLSEANAAISQVNARYDIFVERAILDYQVGALK